MPGQTPGIFFANPFSFLCVPNGKKYAVCCCARLTGWAGKHEKQGKILIIFRLFYVSVANLFSYSSLSSINNDASFVRVSDILYERSSFCPVRTDQNPSGMNAKHERC